MKIYLVEDNKDYAGQIEDWIKEHEFTLFDEQVKLLINRFPTNKFEEYSGKELINLILKDIVAKESDIIILDLAWNRDEEKKLESVINSRNINEIFKSSDKPQVFNFLDKLTNDKNTECSGIPLRNIPIIIWTKYNQAIDRIFHEYYNDSFNFFIIQKPDVNPDFSLLQTTIEECLQFKKILMEHHFYAASPTKNNIEKISELFNIAMANDPVYIYGKSGTGKQVFAELIHCLSNRKDKPFVHVDCGSFTENLLESELFGHVRGAFTSAENKIGKFELAGTGTIFLDEIKTTLNFQQKLLKVIQEKKFEKVGGNIIIEMKARVISASNIHLKELVKKGEFREDLYYRLNVLDFEVEPLSKRKQDIPILIDFFVKKIINKNPDRINFINKNLDLLTVDREILINYDYPNNSVRELEDILSRCLLKGKSPNSVISGLQGKENIKIDSKTEIFDKLYTVFESENKKDLKGYLQDIRCHIIKKAVDNYRTLAEAALSVGMDYKYFVDQKNKCEKRQ